MPEFPSVPMVCAAGGIIGLFSALLRPIAEHHADCGRIELQAPTVAEGIVWPVLGAGIALILAASGSGPAILALLSYEAALLTLCVIDWRKQLLPELITVPLLLGGMAAAASGLALVDLGESIAGAVLWAAGLASADRLSRRSSGRPAFGFGDIVVIAGIGAWSGPGGALIAVAVGTAVAFALNRLGLSRPAETLGAPHLQSVPGVGFTLGGALLPFLPEGIVRLAV